MNLKEELLDCDTMEDENGKSCVGTEHAILTAESYAKEKAWESWKECNKLLCEIIHGSRHELFEESMLFKIEFEEWWEENK